MLYLKKHIFLVFFIFLLLAILICYLFVFKEDTEKKNKNKIPKDNSLEIINSYSEVVIVTNDSSIYELNDGSYNRVGTIKKDTVLNLEYVDVKKEYFKLKNEDFYINYRTVKPYIDDFYVNEEYISFNEKVITNSTFELYGGGYGKFIINKVMEFSIFMKLEDSYLIKFNDKYFNVLKTDINSTYLTGDSEGFATEIPVLNYHFFYDSSFEKCNQLICLEKKSFESQLVYLNDNGFKTLSIKEFDLWMDGKIVLPKKSVLLTVDDGALGTDTHLIELLEKYNIKATLFLITAWWSKDKYYSPNLEIQSHGHDIHLEGYCKNVSRGARGLCLTKEELITDFNLSKSTLGGDIFAFVYPYYLYNNNMIEALKATGFRLAFVGGNTIAKQSGNKYLIPRYIIYSYTDINAFKDIVN